MANIKLHSTRIDGKWFKIKTFKTVEETNEFLQKHPDFSLLKELETYSGAPLYAVARNDDKGVDILKLTFESEDTGFCQRFYKAECGRLFVVVDGRLHTCNDDAWREPCTPVHEHMFKLVG